MTPLWQEDAVFNHRTHRALGCAECHAGASTSSRTVTRPSCQESLSAWHATRTQVGPVSQAEQARLAPSATAITTAITPSKGSVPGHVEARLRADARATSLNGRPWTATSKVNLFTIRSQSRLGG